MLLLLLLSVCLSSHSLALAELEIFSNRNQNQSEMAIALSEISRGLQTTKTITLLNYDARESMAINEIIMEIHRRQLETCVFNDTRNFFRFIEANLRGSLEVTALIFGAPEKIIDEVRTSKGNWQHLDIFNFSTRFTLEISRIA
jgi:hypothetical protein